MRKEKKEKQEKFHVNDEIKGNFVICGKPKMDINDQNKITEWIFSLVRLSEIKTIHKKLNDFIPTKENQCVFFTYKDEWYICHMDCRELTENINYFLNKEHSHGSEVTGNNTRSHLVREAKEHVLQGNSVE